MSSILYRDVKKLILPEYIATNILIFNQARQEPNNFFLRQKEIMECPVCYKTVNKSAANTVVLECSHVFCGKCACEWIILKKTCPICRAHSNHFDRQTRSKTRANEVSNDVQEVWQSCIAIFGGDMPVPIFTGIIDRYFLVKENKGLWNRPQMKIMKETFKDLCYLLDETHIEGMTSEQISIVTKFMHEM